MARNCWQFNDYYWWDLSSCACSKRRKKPKKQITKEPGEPGDPDKDAYGYDQFDTEALYASGNEAPFDSSQDIGNAGQDPPNSASALGDEENFYQVIPPTREEIDELKAQINGLEQKFEEEQKRRKEELEELENKLEGKNSEAAAENINQNVGRAEKTGSSPAAAPPAPPPASLVQQPNASPAAPPPPQAPPPAAQPEEVSASASNKEAEAAQGTKEETPSASKPEEGLQRGDLLAAIRDIKNPLE